MKKLAKETWIIAAIALADLVTTIIFIRHHGAQEANPVFSRYWNMGIWPFILAKSICVIAPLFVLEWARRRNPRFVSYALRAAIIGYVGLYSIGFMRLNVKPAQADIVRPPMQAGIGPSPGFVFYAKPWYYMHFMQIRSHKGPWSIERVHRGSKYGAKTHFAVMTSMPPM